jgi:parallel beta-helix repeat protein
LLERPDRSNILLLVVPPFAASRIDVMISILSRLEVFFETLRLLAMDFLLYFRTTFPRTMITSILSKIRIFCQFFFIIEVAQLSEHINILYLQYYRGQHTEICPRNIFEITGRKSGYGITHSINSLSWVSLSMEPKSIAFYTAVAVSILAVLSATTFPIAQATTATTTTTNTEQSDAQSEENTEQSDAQSEENNAAIVDDTDTSEETEETEEEDTEAEDTNSAANTNDQSEASNDNRATSQSLGLDSSNGLVSCGQIVTGEVVLTNDLNCSNGDGLIVGAPGTHINLNGYKITASDDASTQGPSMDYDGSSGILVANMDGVIISGLGEISGFSRGVTFMGSSDGQLTDVQLADNGIGALVQGSTGTELSRNTITNNDIAAILDSSTGGAVAFNQAVANTEQGFLLLGADQNVIAANNMFGNGQYGIYLDLMSNENIVDYNTVFGHEDYDMSNADGNPNVNQNTFGGNNNCGTSNPGGLCR